MKLEIPTWRSLIRGRFSYLFMSLVLLLLGYPWLEQVAYSTTFVLFACLAAGTHSIFGRTRISVWAIGLAAIAFVLLVAGDFSGSRPLSVAASITATVFFTFVFFVTVIGVLHDEVVTADTVLGAVSGYLLLGIIGALLFECSTFWQPGAFHVAEAHLSTEMSSPGVDAKPYRFSILLYYSVITLTTLGYGEIYPIKPGARSIAMILSISGQIYMAVFVARAVGLMIAHARERDAA